MTGLEISIVSGGQTGVDRAALDWAIQRGLSHGGWCPRGRLAEDGEIDRRYALRETESTSYRQRTRQNVIDSDGTLILNIGELRAGTLSTLRFAERYGKPHRVVQLDREPRGDDPPFVMAWVRHHGIAILNIAGPRESTRPGIYGLAREFLESLG